MMFTSIGSLIHLCIDDLQELLINQGHNEVFMKEADSPSMWTNHKMYIKINLLRPTRISQILFLHF